MNNDWFCLAVFLLFWKKLSLITIVRVRMCAKKTHKQRKSVVGEKGKMDIHATCSYRWSHCKHSSSVRVLIRSCRFRWFEDDFIVKRSVEKVLLWECVTRRLLQNNFVIEENNFVNGNGDSTHAGPAVCGRIQYGTQQAWNGHHFQPRELSEQIIDTTNRHQLRL